MTLVKKTFNHSCAACESVFISEFSKDDYIKAFIEHFPEADLDHLKLICPTCKPHLLKHPDQEYKNYLFKCGGCQKSLFKVAGDDYTNFTPSTTPGPVIFRPKVKLCPTCYEKAVMTLN